MPTSITTAGALAMSRVGFHATHEQRSNVRIPPASLVSTTALSGVLVTLPITNIERRSSGAQAQLSFRAIDDDPTRVYDDWVSWAVWSGEPGAQGSVILVAGSRETGIYAEKSVGVDLGFTHDVVVSHEQAENVTVVRGQYLTASRTREGLIQLASEDEEVAGTSVEKASTPGGRQAWWTRTWAAIGDLSSKVRAGTTTVTGILRLATQAESEAATSRAVAQTPRGTRDWWAKVVVAANKVSGKLTLSNMPDEFRRHITATLFDSSFPASPTTGANVYFSEAVASGLSWRDTDGTTPLTSAKAGDWAQWTGSVWRKQVGRTGDVFLIPE